MTDAHAIFSYEDGGYRASDLVKVLPLTTRKHFLLIILKMTFLLNHKPVDALALVVHASAAHDIGQKWVKKLSKNSPF